MTTPLEKVLFSSPNLPAGVLAALWPLAQPNAEDLADLEPAAPLPAGVALEVAVAGNAEVAEAAGISCFPEADVWKSALEADELPAAFYEGLAKNPYLGVEALVALRSAGAFAAPGGGNLHSRLIAIEKDGIDAKALVEERCAEQLADLLLERTDEEHRAETLSALDGDIELRRAVVWCMDTRDHDEAERFRFELCDGGAQTIDRDLLAWTRTEGALYPEMGRAALNVRPDGRLTPAAGWWAIDSAEPELLEAAHGCKNWAVQAQARFIKNEWSMPKELLATREARWHTSETNIEMASLLGSSVRDQVANLVGEIDSLPHDRMVELLPEADPGIIAKVFIGTAQFTPEPGDVTAVTEALDATTRAAILSRLRDYQEQGGRLGEMNWSGELALCFPELTEVMDGVCVARALAKVAYEHLGENPDAWAGLVEGRPAFSGRFEALALAAREIYVGAIGEDEALRV